MRVAFLFRFLPLLALMVFARAAETPDFSPVEAQIQEWVGKGYYPGASLLVCKDGRVLCERYFGAAKPDSVVYLASAGKWLAAATIAAVVDDGKLGWDDPVSKWLPEFTDIKGRATLRQLLSHTSGYPAYQPEGQPVDNYQTLAESVARIIPLPAVAEPGAQFEYGGLAMQVAGRMAEMAAGMDWETIFQKKIAGPLEMRATHFTPVDTVQGGHAPMLGGGARGTLGDYGRFLEMLSQGGMFKGRRILSEKAIRETQSDQVRDAKVEAGCEFVEKARGTKHHGIYGLGEWREELNTVGEAVLLSSPSWAGTYPWIDKTNGVYGVFLAHVDVHGPAGKDRFSSFYSSPVLAMLVREAVKARGPDFSKADAKIQEWMDAGFYPGASLWIVDKSGQTLHERHWGGYNRETRFMMASASKWLEAATMMTLVDDGKFDLDQPIGTYLPELKNSPQGKNTLRQMFSHTSSLNHIQIDERRGVNHFPALLAAAHTEVKPGAVFQYGGTALATAFRAVEVVTDDPWMTYFARRIAGPCRMRGTFTGADPWSYDRIVGGDNFPFTCAGDYMNFLRMILNDGEFEGTRVLSKKSVGEMQADQIRGAAVKKPEYPEDSLGEKHRAVYGLGEWRMVLDEKGEAVVVASPSFAGFLPWIDHKHGIAGVYVGRVIPGVKFNAFVSSPVILKLVGEALDATSSPP